MKVSNNNTASSPFLKYRRIARILLPILILAIGVGAVLYYVIALSPYYITGDSTDSMRWAQATYESGRLTSDNFYYAALLPFGGNLIFLPFIAMFGYSLTAQICGMSVFVLLLSAALYYMATGIGLDRYRSSALVTVTLLLLSSSAKLREIMWEHIFYYNLGILFFCLGIGLAARILRDGGTIMSCENAKNKRFSVLAFLAVTLAALLLGVWGVSSVVTLFVTLLIMAAAIFAVILLRNRCAFAKKWGSDLTRLVVLAVFSFFAATNGLQTLVCFSLPVLAGILAERLFDSDTKLLSMKNACALGVAAVLGASSLLGYIMIESVNGDVTAGYADAYSSYSAMSTWTDNFLGFFKNWFSLFGVEVLDKDPMVSGESVINMIRIFGALILLIVPIILLLFYKKINSRGVRIALVAHFAVSAFILFAVTFGRLGGANWRLTPMLGTSIILTLVAAFELIRQKACARRFGALILAFFIVVALPSLLWISGAKTGTGDNIAWHTAAKALDERGLKYGYANFWFAETLTLISNGELEVANISENKSSPVQYAYQVSKDAFDDKADAENYFLLLTEKENDQNMRQWLSKQRALGTIADEFVIETEGYDLRGHVGTRFYVYIFSENIF